MPKQTTSKDKGDNPYETNWIKIAPRPEWERADYWKECHGLVPARTVEG